MDHTATGTATVTLTDATVNRPTAGRTSLRIPPVLGPLSVELGTGVVGVVGRNGAGKTTLLGLIAGQLRPTIGHVVHSVADGRDGTGGASGTTSRDAFDLEPALRYGTQSRGQRTAWASSSASRHTRRSRCWTSPTLAWTPRAAACSTAH